MSSDHELRLMLASMVERARLTSIDTTGAQHLVRATGRAGEGWVAAPRVKDFGFSSSPPVGAVGLALALGGRPDRTMILGLDHADHGPRDLAVGHTAIYDAHGNAVSLVGRKLRIVAADAVEIVAAHGATLTAEQIVLVSSDIRLGSPNASARVATEAGLAEKVRAE